MFLCALRYSCSLLSQSLHFLVSASTFVSHSLYQILCKCAKYILNNRLLPLANLPFPLLFCPLRGGLKKCQRRHILVLREPISTNNFAKNHFSLFPLFRSDNTIFHNKNNISIFYKILKICKICGCWVEYNY